MDYIYWMFGYVEPEPEPEPEQPSEKTKQARHNIMKQLKYMDRVKKRREKKWIKNFQTAKH